MIEPTALSEPELRQLCLEAGADDVGFCSIDHPLIADQVEDLRRCFAPVQSLISLVFRMHREPIRSPNRAVANLEFHACGDQGDQVARKIVRRLEDQGVRALNPAVGFPMDMDRFPGKTWDVSHKPVAEAAGLGKMGLHRNLIHPQYGSFVLLATVLLDRPVDHSSQPIDFNPCFGCKLCVAACPVGAIEPDGYFNFGACYTHNYREFMGGFSDWAEGLAESRTRSDYRRRVSDSESASMWQSLSFGANYKAAYCLAACPAGEDVIGPYRASPAQFLQETVKPLQNKPEKVYLVAGSDAEAVVKKRFPKKTIRYVSGLRPSNLDSFFTGLKLTFQRAQSKGLKATYHFDFSGAQSGQGTVVLDHGQLKVSQGLQGTPDLLIRGQGESWIRFFAESSLWFVP